MSAPTYNTLTDRFSTRAFEQIEQPVFDRHQRHVGVVEPPPLHQQDREHVAPLSVRHFATVALPQQLLDQDVFRRVHEPSAKRIVAHDDRPTTFELTAIEC